MFDILLCSQAFSNVHGFEHLGSPFCGIEFFAYSCYRLCYLAGVWALSM